MAATNHLIDGNGGLVPDGTLETRTKYLNFIQYDSVRDYEFVSNDPRTTEFTRTVPNVEKFFEVVDLLNLDLNSLYTEFNNRARGAANIKKPESAQDSLNDLFRMLIQYTNIFRTLIGSAGIFATVNASATNDWVSRDFIGEHRTKRENLIAKWREIRVDLKTTAGYTTELAMSVGQFGSTKQLNQRSTNTARENEVVHEDESLINLFDATVQDRTSAPVSNFPRETGFSGPQDRVVNWVNDHPRPNNSRLGNQNDQGKNTSQQLGNHDIITTPIMTASWKLKEPARLTVPESQPERHHSAYHQRASQEGTGENLSRGELADLVRALSVNRKEPQEATHFRMLNAAHPKFSGEITEFPAWFDSYQQFIGNSNKDNYIKLLNLRELLEGEALRKIFGAGMQLRGEFYPIAINRLLKEYDCAASLMRGYYDRLERITTPEINDLEKLRAVYEEILMIVTAMKCSNDDMGIRRTIERKFPQQLILEVLRKQYHRHQSQHVPLQEFLEDIDGEISSLENVKRMSNNYRIDSTQRETPGKRYDSGTRYSKNTYVHAAVSQYQQELDSGAESSDLDTDNIEMTAQLLAVYQHDRQRTNQDNAKNWGTLSKNDRNRAVAYKNPHICNLCNARQKRHYEHRCPKFSTFELRLRKIVSEERCLSCFEKKHTESDICPRAGLKCPIQQCTETHGLAVCEKYADYVVENKGNFTLRQFTTKRN